MTSKFQLRLVLLIYNLLLPVVLLIGVGPWVLKMFRRGGFGTGLLERVGIYGCEVEFEPSGVVYVHAVSVGEVLIALKLIEAWQGEFPEDQFVIAPTTATGHAVAVEKAPSAVRVVYSPVDIPFVVSRMLRRFEPKQIVLIESEVWPNLLAQAYKRGVKITVANARLSDRSEKRYHKISGVVSPLFALFDKVGVPDERDVARWKNLGVRRDALTVTGSVKFDQQGAAKPEKKAEFQQMLDAFGQGRKIVMALSTHIGEEKWIAGALQDVDALCVIVPRHAERRAEVRSDIESLGQEVVLRSDFHAPEDTNKTTFVIDSTGELKNWTAHADVAIIGKSFLSKGGQNPTEAIAAGIPVITGPYMGNFEPLMTMLKDAESVITASTADELRENVLSQLELSDQQMQQRALSVLDAHQGATLRTVNSLRV